LGLGIYRDAGGGREERWVGGVDVAGGWSRAVERWVGGFVFANFVFVAGGGGRRGGRFVAIALELEEIAEGARVGAGEAGFHAVQDVEGGAVGEPFEGGGEGLVGSEGVIGIFFDAVDGFDKELGFDAGDAVEAPLSGDHFMDEVEFDGADGAELLEVGGEEGVEVGGVFGGEDEGLGTQSVLEGILGGAGAAGFGFGAAGFCAVDAGGLGFGWHEGRIRDGRGARRMAGGQITVIQRDVDLIDV